MNTRRKTGNSKLGQPVQQKTSPNSDTRGGPHAPPADAGSGNALPQQPGLLDDGFASIKEACEYLSISRAKLYQLMDAQAIAYAKFGTSRRIPWRALRTYAESCMVG